jgi:UDP-glucose 4-epimerase
MTVCIFGGTGFIGRHLCELLHRSNVDAVTISRNPDLSFLAAWAPSIRAVQLEDPMWHDAIRKASSIVYLAEPSKPNWDQGQIERELKSSLSAMQTIVRTNPAADFIYASSGGQIYGRGNGQPAPETRMPAPETAYAHAKYMAEQALQSIAAAEGTNLTVLRIANPVGRWQYLGRHGFVSAAVEAALTGGELTIFGEGTNQRDYFDVDDLAELIAQLIDSPQHRGVFNVGSGIGRTELAVTSFIEDITGQAVQCRLLPARPSDIPYAVVDPTRARVELGWHAKTSFQAIIEKMVGAYRARL